MDFRIVLFVFYRAGIMAQFESSVKYVPYSQEQVFNKLSDLSNLESVRDKLADKVQGMEFDRDSLSFTVQGISITLRAHSSAFRSRRAPSYSSKSGHALNMNLLLHHRASALW